METLIVITFVLILGIFFYYFKNRKTDIPIEKEYQEITSGNTNYVNDKLIVVTDVSKNNIEEVLNNFCKLYNEEKVQAYLLLHQLGISRFAISFPQDIEGEIFYYLINYLVYPENMDWNASVKAWATNSGTDEFIPNAGRNKRACFYIPQEDTEHDNVYMTTEDNINFKIGFSMNDQRILDAPGKFYSSPPVLLRQLNTKESALIT